MAQQTLDFIIANQVTGLNEIAKLTNSVGALQKATADLNARTAELERMMGAGAKAIKGFTNPLDAQSKALRNQRQGMQMAGMQVNDFVTSVSTGASPVQAFNQQIGQLGYAMSMMGGVAGRIGNFLAGPWSIAVIGASMVLGPMIANLFGVTEESKKTTTSLEDLEEITQDRIDSENDIRLALARTAGEYRAIQGELVNTILQKHNLLRVTHEEIRQNLVLAKAERDAIRGRAAEMARAAGSARGAAEAGAIFAETGTGQAEVDAQTQALIESTAILERSTTKLNAARLRVIQTDNRAAREARDGAGAAREQANELSELEEKLKSLTEKYAPQTGALEVARVAYERGIITLRQYNAELTETLGLTDRSLKLEPFKLPTDFEQQWEKMTDPKPLKAYDENIANVTERLVAHRDAVQSVGQTVASGFQGMITGARSFGDVMKSVIESVISELFRLFVVQQIVGLVGKAVGPAFGSFDPVLGARAMGGSVGQNKPYLVGERGPEIFVPGKSGTIIPTQNSRMGGGGGSTINVSVDARGATSPEMVRQQVQQGILEAAPSIVAAAEQRTITTLRRPRLAGAL